MGDITIPQLIALGTSTTSNGRTLVGRLYTLRKNTKGHTRGTVYLMEPTTKQKITCLIDKFHVKVDTARVKITNWNFIHERSLGLRYLEFSLDNVYMKDSTMSVLRSGIIDDANAMDEAIEEGLVFYKPTPSLATISDEAINITGVVEAISIISGEVATYFVQISNEENAHLITIYFHGNEFIKYHLCFRYGQYCSFRNVSFTQVAFGDRVRGVLLFGNNSSFQVITSSIYRQINLERNYLEEMNDGPELTVSPIDDEKTTYTGYVTRIIDHQFGIYELDNKMTLCIYHHLEMSPNRPYRAGTRISISHFHKAVVYANQTSFLFNDVWKAPRLNEDSPYVVLVACVKTRIDIVSLPDHCDIGLKVQDDLMRQFTSFLSFFILESHCTISRVLRLLEIYAVLITRFDIETFTLNQLKESVKSIYEHVLKKTDRTFGHLGNDFFQHKLTCSAIGSEQLLGDNGCIIIHMDSYPYIKTCVDTLSKDLKPYQLDLAGSYHAFEPNTAQVYAAEHEGKDYYIIGAIDIVNDGRFILKDSQSQVFISTTSTQILQIGSLYLLRQCQLFKEDLSHYIELEKQIITITYIGCYENALINTNINSKQKQLKFQIRHDLRPHLLQYFCVPLRYDKIADQNQYVIAHIVGKNPISTSLTAKGFLSLECRINARLYNVGPHQDNFIKTDPSVIYQLVLNSRYEGLPFHTQLQIDDWCVIYGLNVQETEIKTSFPSTFILDNTHQVYPIIFNYNYDPSDCQVVHFAPVFGESNIHQNLPGPILTIEELIDLNRPGHDNECELVNVSGIVVLKKFDRFCSGGVFEKYAGQLFEDFGLGTGTGSRKIQVQLRSPNSLNTITIYLDLTYIHYPLGLVHGSTVIFRNLFKRKAANSKFSYNSARSTLIQIINTTSCS